MEEEDPSEFPGGVEVGPVNSGPTVSGEEDEGLERGVQRSQVSEVGWVLGVFVSQVGRRSLLLSLPLLIFVHRHLRVNYAPVILRSDTCGLAS